MEAEVICSNCGKKVILRNYTPNEPCRFCGYKRTEILKVIAKCQSCGSHRLKLVDEDKDLYLCKDCGNTQTPML